jgi:hypothetical protein
MTLPSNKSSVIAGSLQEYDTIAIKNTINRFDLFIVFCFKKCVINIKVKVECKVQDSHPFQQ